MKRLILVCFLFMYCGSKNNSVTPPVSQKLKITDLSAKNARESDPCADTVSYEITFKTTKNATSRLYWGSDKSVLNSVIQSDSVSTNHYFKVEPLLTGADYYYVVKAVSEDAEDSTATDTLTLSPEKGDIETPTFTDIRIVPYPEHAYIYYTISHAAKSKVFYGLTEQYGYMINGSKTNYLFYERMDSLIPDTVVHYSIALEDNCGNISEADWDSTFRTPPLPEIYFDPDSISGNPGDTVEMKVYIKNIINLMSVEYQFYFPTGLLNYVGMKKGDLLNESAYQMVQFLFLPNPPVSDRKGAVSTWRIRYVNNYYVTGSYMQHPLYVPGHIATFQFEVKENVAGNGEFNFSTERIRFLDPFYTELNFISYDGEITVDSLK